MSLAGRRPSEGASAQQTSVCAGARTTTAAIGQITETAKSQVPALGYTVPYAIGNTLLIIWGIVIVMLMT